ncbi:putative transcription factor FAR family [Helianthus annuus]|uniref:protein FAR1-RELATED SEQUENCE 5-like n=1 Tax=Helianthus annuus TaxID=4232 RepID=UPI00165318C2|nr:protein FAR1-RELATED SEQUENCE 5-like [Helianthus annuus]KAJ0956638.1 putative transcription factor FAR family [Helianthus annuus]
MEFSSIEQAYVFYQTYAKKAGFSARKGGEHHVGGIIRSKYFVCSKEGHKPQAFDDNYSKLSKPYKRRNRPTIRTGCKAQIKLCSTDGVLFKVDKFVQSHNHSFVCPKDMHLLPAYRHLSETQEEMIWELGTLNLGPVKAFNIMRKRYGGFENVGATKDDCKNFRARIHSYIGQYDADMVINRLTDKKKFMVDYSFFHSVDENKRLTGLFWADGLCKRNYAEFGDVISFDATFKTNKYKMVFVPFTGIDNHCRNVTLGAGLLASESIESYKWLLQSFLNSFGKQPNVVVTDQDPAMKQAIEAVFDKSRHRLCMWHIMKKLADKVGHQLCNNEDFKRRMCDIVWTDSITPEMFEREWKLIMIDFGLTENKWLDDMFCMRSSWIPAFYRHEPMSGLMRTTSRSESENHFFCQVANSQLTLVEFFNHFDGAMDIQRFNHRKNDHISRNTVPGNFSESTLEDDAMKIYTRSIFADQQAELQGTLSECLPIETKIEEPFLRISMKDWKAHGDGLLEVCFKKGEDVIALCTCRRFEQYGLLCKHIYFVFKMFKVKEIPNKYVMRRWTKDVVPNDLNNTFDITVDGDDAHKKAKEVAYEIMQTGEYLIGNLIKDFDHLLIVRDRMREMKEMVDELRITKPIDPKFDRYSRLIGYEKPNTDEPPTVRVPTGIRNKGRGSHKRIKSKKEKIISLKGKRGRTCSHCNIKGHDIRTCKVLKGEATAAADKVANKEGRKRRAIQLEKDPNLIDEEDEEVETGDEEVETGDEEEFEESDEAEDSDFECEDE